MSERRKSLSAMAADIGPVPEIPVHDDTERAVPPPRAEPAPRQPRRLREPRDTAVSRDDIRPSARDLAAPAREHISREALKADVPVELDLVRRLRRYRADKGIDMRDQVAIAVDEWLNRQGY